MSIGGEQSTKAAAPGRGSRWRRPVALLVYVVGSLWSLAALQATLSSLIGRDWGMIPAWFIIAVAGWWITAGIGVRLGVVPRDFITWLGRALGFERDLSPSDRR